MDSMKETYEMDDEICCGAATDILDPYVTVHLKHCEIVCKEPHTFDGPIMGLK